MNDLDTLFEKYNTESKLKKMYDFIRDKYVVADAPALLAPMDSPDGASAPELDAPPSSTAAPVPRAPSSDGTAREEDGAGAGAELVATPPRAKRVNGAILTTQGGGGS